jgi:hypothetical protein
MPISLVVFDPDRAGIETPGTHLVCRKATHGAYVWHEVVVVSKDESENA